MKSFEQLAKSAFDAAFKKSVELGLCEQNERTHWHELDPHAREVWIAAAKQLWAELAAIH
jgi:hypothetical protein